MKYLHKISRIQFKKASLIQGTVLWGRKDADKKEGLKSILSSYSEKPCKDCSITVVVGSNNFQVKTDRAGAFQLTVNKDVKGELRFLDDNHKEIPILQSYPYEFQESDFKLSVISDLDDTVLVSHTRNVLKRIGTILFVNPLARIAIGFTQNILNEIAKYGGDVYYVSKSETNLFGILSHFLGTNNLPKGNLFLTSYLKFSQLLNPKKGKQYKEQTIYTIIKNTTNKQFVLIGDDTQNDVSVYANIVKKHPEAIFKVYIRKTVKNKIRLQKHHLDAIEKLNVPFLYFDDNHDIKKELEWINKTIEL